MQNRINMTQFKYAVKEKREKIMRKELPYFRIDSSYGGNQNWFRDPTMYMGGCAAATACDCCINLALFNETEHLYPYDVHRLNREEYIKFSKKMKPFLHPRPQGIKTLKLFVDGFQRYIQEFGEAELNMTEFSGELPVERAEIAIRMQIDSGIPIPFLLLKHKNSNISDFTWHWFVLAGYELYEKEFLVKIVTYGNYHWFSLHELWNTGYKEKGGMIIIN